MISLRTSKVLNTARFTLQHLSSVWPVCVKIVNTISKIFVFNYVFNALGLYFVTEMPTTGLELLTGI